MGSIPTGGANINNMEKKLIELEKKLEELNEKMKKLNSSIDEKQKKRLKKLNIDTEQDY